MRFLACAVLLACFASAICAERTLAWIPPVPVCVLTVSDPTLGLSGTQAAPVGSLDFLATCSNPTGGVNPCKWMVWFDAYGLRADESWGYIGSACDDGTLACGSANVDKQAINYFGAWPAANDGVYKLKTTIYACSCNDYYMGMAGDALWSGSVSSQLD